MNKRNNCRNYISPVELPLHESFIEMVLPLCIGPLAVGNFKQVKPSIKFGPFLARTFCWPNIYDVMEFIVVSQLLEYRCPAAELIAIEMIDEIASLREFLTFEAVDLAAFEADPAGLKAALDQSEEIVRYCIECNSGCECADDEFQRILQILRVCVGQFNQLVSRELLSTLVK